MDNKPLEYDSYYAFSMSHFECYAEGAECDGKKCIMVNVYFDGSGDSLMSRKFPVTMTLGEIKSGMAVFILKEMQEMREIVLDYWADHVTR